jgi:hypothetical protein
MRIENVVATWTIAWGGLAKGGDRVRQLGAGARPAPGEGLAGLHPLSGLGASVAGSSIDGEGLHGLIRFDYEPDGHDGADEPLSLARGPTDSKVLIRLENRRRRPALEVRRS